jgi:hypothetical protein
VDGRAELERRVALDDGVGLVLRRAVLRDRLAVPVAAGLACRAGPRQVSAYWPVEPTFCDSRAVTVLARPASEQHSLTTPQAAADTW